MDQRRSDGRWAELVEPGRLAATTTLCLGVALFAFNEFLVTTSMPTAAGELGGVALIAWTVTLYLLGAIVGGAATALMKVRFGARVTLLAAAAVFLAGTLVCAAAPAMSVVIVGRLLQGLGEGVIAALCYTLIPELFPSRLVPKVFGAEAMVWATAAFGGPLTSGWITEAISWRAAFLVNLPVVALFAGLVLVVVPPGRSDGRRPPLPVKRLALLAAAVLAVCVAGVTEATAAKALLVLGAVAGLVALVRADRDRPERIFPTGAFRLDGFLGTGLWVVLLMPLAQASTAVYLILTLQRLWGYGPLLAGAIGAVMAVAWSLSAIVVANIREPERQTRLVAVGPALLVAGLVGVAAGFGYGAPVVVAVAQGTIGVGYGLSWGYLSQRLMEAAPAGERDRTSALLPTLQSAGYALGAAVGGVVANAAGYPDAATPEAARAAALAVFGAAAAISLAAAVAGFRAVRLWFRPASNGLPEPP